MNLYICFQGLTVGCEFLYFFSGIDSRYNDGMTELMNYLLFGFFELRKTELEKYI